MLFYAGSMAVGGGKVVPVEVGTCTEDTTAWVDCCVTAKVPFILVSPSFTCDSGGGAESIGLSTGVSEGVGA